MRIQNIQQVTNPAANAEWTYTVPAARRMGISSILYQSVVASGTVYQKLRITDGTNVIKEFSTLIGQTASTVNICAGHYGEDRNSLAGGLNALNITPELILETGWTIETVTGGTGVGVCTYTKIFIVWEEIA